MKKTTDVIVIGAGIVGMATAYHLAQSGVQVTVVEREFIGSGSTGRCIAGIRQQFSTPASINLSKTSIELFKEMEERFGFSVEFLQGGYLLLAHSEDLVDVFKNNIKTQKNEGVDVNLIKPEEISAIVPDLNLDGILAAAYCPDDASAYPFSVLKGYKKALDEKQAEFFLNNPVVNIEKKGNSFIVTLKNNQMVESPRVVLAAGPWTAELGKLLGLSFPFYPERHEAMITERLPQMFKPMVVDYRPDGCYFQQIPSGQIIGCYTPHPNVPGINVEASRDFALNIASRMTRLVPRLDKAAVLRHWAGCYTMTPDGNPIVDETKIENLFVASGMSGHGFMFGPALGKHLAHFVLNKKWQTDLSEFSINREFVSQETLK